MSPPTPHTPTPWKVKPLGSHGNVSVHAVADDRPVAVTATVRPPERGQDAANAALIVRACYCIRQKNRRYFAAPKGLLAAEDIPAGWGLLEIEENSHAALSAENVALRDALVVSPDLPLADVLAKLARLEARNAKRAQDNAALVAFAQEAIHCIMEVPRGEMSAARWAELADQARAALAGAKE